MTHGYSREGVLTFIKAVWLAKHLDPKPVRLFEVV